MKKNSILIDSGYGSYLRKDIPKAIANEFVPNLITTASELANGSENNQYIWRSYLHEIQDNITRTERLREIDRKLAKFGGT